jgi:uncharacterized protein with NAD-binding domain and iron-sulfur cluster
MSQNQTRRERVVILGGGIGALTTAFELTATPALRARYEVTLYQLGWRLGGKLASGRDARKGYRNLEHGLHVWFGFYENAFRLTKRLFAEWKKPEGCPFKTWRDAFTPQSLTPLGLCIKGKRSYLPITWPMNDEEPGTGQVELTPWGVATELLSALKLLLTHHSEGTPGSLAERVVAKLLEEGLELVGDALDKAIRVARELDEALGGEPHELLGDLLSLLCKLTELVLDAAGDVPPDEVDAHPVRNAFEVGIAFLRGLLNPAYGILEDFDLDRLDRLEFRAWLKDNGASSVVVDHWSAVRALYDTIFQYRDGDLTRPDLAAGTAARIMIRILFTYKGAVMWLINAGMGETIIGPLYDVLRERGVRFEFFHKLTGMELSPDGKQVSTLRFARQAEPKDGAYRPTFLYKGLTCWPSEPVWDQLVGGPAMAAAGVDFESHWCDWPASGETILQVGADFDTAVLGLDLGAWKQLNADLSPCQALLDQKPRVRAMAEAIPLVPTMALQLWMGKTLEELGFRDGKPAMVDWAFPCDVWADMSQLLEVEDWRALPPPRTLHYLCGVLDTAAFKEPRAARGVQERENAALGKRLAAQIETWAHVIWPRFAWSDLSSDTQATGAARLDAQFYKANVSPGECCVGAPAGTHALRLGVDESGVGNLYFTGGWVKSNITATCVEATVMVGMAAARAISGAAIDIVGETFMSRPAREARRASEERTPRVV